MTYRFHEDTERFLLLLESGAYQRGRYVLHNVTEGTYCVWGVACDDYAGLHPDEVRRFPITIEFKTHPLVGHEIEVFEGPGFFASSHQAPLPIVEAYGFTNRGMSALMALNDDTSKSFAELAAEVRSHPDRYLRDGFYEAVAE